MSEIGVSDLCAVSGVSRSTFYRMFDTPLDVLEYTSDVYIAKTVEDYSGAVFKSVEDFVMFSLVYWKNHSDLLEAVVNCDRLDIIHRSFERQSGRLIPFLKMEFNETEIEYVRTGAASLIASLLSVWVQRGKKETPFQLMELFRKFYSVTYLLPVEKLSSDRNPI